MSKHPMNSKMESPSFKKWVSLAVIQMFALKALKKFLQNLLLSPCYKSYLLLLHGRLMLPQEFK